MACGKHLEDPGRGMRQRGLGRLGLGLLTKAPSQTSQLLGLRGERSCQAGPWALLGMCCWMVRLALSARVSPSRFYVLLKMSDDIGTLGGVQVQPSAASCLPKGRSLPHKDSGLQGK